MDSVATARHLWRHKPRIALVLVLALLGAVLVAYRVSIVPFGLHKRSLEVGAASSQILVDTPRSTLVAGASPEQFDTLAARARVYGEYLSTLQAREQIAAASGIPAATITTSGPFSPESGQVSYENQTSASRAGELLKEGAGNRLVFTAQEGVPIITVNAQAATAATAIRLAQASFVTLRRYVGELEKSAPGRKTSGVVVRQLGAPVGGTIGGSNDKVLMVLSFLAITALGCAMIIVVPRLRHRWRTLDAAERSASENEVGATSAAGNGAVEPLQSEELEHAASATAVNGNGAASGKPADPPTERSVVRR